MLLRSRRMGVYDLIEARDLERDGIGMDSGCMMKIYWLRWVNGWD